MAETETGNGIKAKGVKDAEEHVYTPQITVRPKKKKSKTTGTTNRANFKKKGEIVIFALYYI